MLAGNNLIPSTGTWRCFSFDRLTFVIFVKFPLANIYHNVFRSTAPERNIFPEFLSDEEDILTWYNQTLNSFFWKVLFHSILRFCFRNVCWTVRISDIRQNRSPRYFPKKFLSWYLSFWNFRILGKNAKHPCNWKRWGSKWKREKITFSLRAAKRDYA